MKKALHTAQLVSHRFMELFFHNRWQGIRLIFIATIGFLGIGFWGLYADLVLSNLLTVAVAQLMLVVYFVTMAILLERLVRSHDRWQVESALTFRQLLAEAKSFSGDSQAGSPFYARRLREQLGEQLRRCEQYGTPLAVVAFRLELPGQSPSHAVFTQANRDVADLLTHHYTAMTCPTALGLFDYAAFIPNCDRRAAASVIGFLSRTLGRYQWYAGIAVAPDDGRDPDVLLQRAIAECGALHAYAA